jgi:hypothetical protein
MTTLRNLRFLGVGYQEIARKTVLMAKDAFNETKNLDNKQAFYFSDFDSGEELLRVGDINPSYAKNYYYIFAGKKDVGDGYTMIIMQEF